MNEPIDRERETATPFAQQSQLRRSYNGPVATAFESANEIVDRLRAGKLTPLALKGGAPSRPHAPNVAELRALAALCSAAEWAFLLRAHGFFEATARSLAETEAFMSGRLGRKISLSAQSVSNPGDEKL